MRRGLKWNVLCLAALFVLALVPRLYSAQSVGWNWDYPGSFTLINFDEGGSCRAALKGFDYSTFVGYQTIALTQAMGFRVPPGVEGNHRAVKQYCHSPQHIVVARTYSAVTGSLTVVLLGVMALLLVPSKPAVAWTAGALLALSGFHVSESHSGTVDAPSVFFIYAFLTAMVYALKRNNVSATGGAAALLVAAIWAKFWLFAVLAYLSRVPGQLWEFVAGKLTAGNIAVLSMASIVLFALTTNTAFQTAGLYPLLALYYFFVPWRRLRNVVCALFLLLPLMAWGVAQLDVVAAYATGGMEDRFGTGYAAIGWNKWLRNPLNVVAVLTVGLGLPACAFLPAGIRSIVRDQGNMRGWLCLLPILFFGVFMAFISPVTYYRHYLPLIPAAALVSAVGFWSTSWSQRRWFQIFFFAWPALLMFDLDRDYHSDPRVALRDWYAQHTRERVFVSYYVGASNEAMSHSHFFRPEYAFGDAKALGQAEYLILSENWYDTAYANELNGPYVDRLDRLIKTRPEYARFYRQALSGQHPHLRLERSIEVSNFMPELVAHRWLYGTFQMFVGDIKIFRISE